MLIHPRALAPAARIDSLGACALRASGLHLPLMKILRICSDPSLRTDGRVSLSGVTLSAGVRRPHLQALAQVPHQLPLRGAAGHLPHAMLPSQCRPVRQHLPRHPEGTRPDATAIRDTLPAHLLWPARATAHVAARTGRGAHGVFCVLPPSFVSFRPGAVAKLHILIAYALLAVSPSRRRSGPPCTTSAPSCSPFRVCLEVRVPPEVRVPRDSS